MKTSTKRSIDDCLTLKDDLLITSREANDTEKIGIFFIFGHRKLVSQNV